MLLKYWGLSSAKACKSCRSRQELSREFSEYVLYILRPSIHIFIFQSMPYFFIHVPFFSISFSNYCSVDPNSDGLNSDGTRVEPALQPALQALFVAWRTVTQTRTGWLAQLRLLVVRECVFRNVEHIWAERGERSSRWLQIWLSCRQDWQIIIFQIRFLKLDSIVGDFD